jgi:6-phosphogluconolactonase
MGLPKPTPQISAAPFGYQMIVDPDAFISTAAKFLARKLVALTNMRHGSIALSGGSTPGPIYREISQHKGINWSRLNIFFTDERMVSHDDPESNYHLARETLLDRVPIPEEQIYPMPVEVQDGIAPERAYANILPTSIDILVLGIGEDGHTASLFPHSPALNSEAPVAQTRSPRPPFERLSITPTVIKSAQLIVILVRSPKKNLALHHALSNTTSVDEWPARIARKGVWIVGRDVLTTPIKKT